MPLKDSTQTIVFAVVLGLVCALLLTGASRFTQPYREANRRAEEIRNFLMALNAPVDESTSADALLEIFERNVEVREEGGSELYAYRPDPGGEVTTVAVPFQGSGLWGPVKGVMALEPDLKTIRAVRFYDQDETPGLGGEIGAAWFQDQFRGKRFADTEPKFKVVKAGGTTDAHSVEGITGATMTSDRVSHMINLLAENLDKMRGHDGR